jgi:hypothetical protein
VRPAASAAAPPLSSMQTPTQPPFVPDRRPATVAPPAPAPTPTAAKVVVPRRQASAAVEEPDAPHRPASGEGMAAALWGLRTLVSWALLVAAVVFLLLFASPLVSPYVGASVFFPAVVIGQPVVQQIAQALPPVRFGDWDPIPLVLAVALLFLRPRITNPLWRLEARYRARATSMQTLG